MALLRVLSTARCSFPDRRNTSSPSPIAVRRDAVPSPRKALVVSRSRVPNISDSKISHGRRKWIGMNLDHLAASDQAK
jgi:hypothetical protein